MLTPGTAQQLLKTALDAIEDGGTPDEQAQALVEQSARCKRLADATTDTEASQILAAMAGEYAAAAQALKG